MLSSKYRELLLSNPNPNRTTDYISQLDYGLTGGTHGLTLRYVPDKIILEADSFRTYCAALLAEESLSLEAKASVLLEDINNELVARWVQVRAFATQGENQQHSVVFEDKQPQWDNPYLLSRLSHI